MSWFVSPKRSTVSRAEPESSVTAVALTNVLFRPPVKERSTPSLTRMLPRNWSCALMTLSSPGSRPGLTWMPAPLPLSSTAEASSLRVEPAEPARLAESVPELFCKMAKVPLSPMKTCFWPRPCALAMNVPPRTRVSS